MPSRLCPQPLASQVMVVEEDLASMAADSEEAVRLRGSCLQEKLRVLACKYISAKSQQEDWGIAARVF